ncbi:MAG: PrsW family glutamic-type intramembrane protease [Spirochaetia bacterium]
MPETLLRLVVLLLPVALLPLLLRSQARRSATGSLVHAALAGLIGIILALALLEIRRRVLPLSFSDKFPATHALVAAFSEEAAKLAAFFLVFRPEAGPTRPIIRTAAATALVFAVIENAVYVTVPASLLWTRALVVPALHAGCSVVLVAAVLTLRKLKPVQTQTKTSFLGALIALLAVALAVTLHALHNYFMLISSLPFSLRLMPSLLVTSLAFYLHYRSPSHST